MKKHISYPELRLEEQFERKVRSIHDKVKDICGMGRTRISADDIRYRLRTDSLLRTLGKDRLVDYFSDVNKKSLQEEKKSRPRYNYNYS